MVEDSGVCPDTSNVLVRGKGQRKVSVPDGHIGGGGVPSTVHGLVHHRATMGKRDPGTF